MPGYLLTYQGDQLASASNAELEKDGLEVLLNSFGRAPEFGCDKNIVPTFKYSRYDLCLAFREDHAPAGGQYVLENRSATVAPRHSSELDLEAAASEHAERRGNDSRSRSAIQLTRTPGSEPTRSSIGAKWSRSSASSPSVRPISRPWMSINNTSAPRIWISDSSAFPRRSAR